jgi:hypothetical protein
MSKRLLINRTIVGQQIFNAATIFDTLAEAKNISDVTASGGILVNPVGYEAATAKAQSQNASGLVDLAQQTMNMAYFTASGTAVPSGGDDRATLQSILDSGLPLILKSGATFRLSAALNVPANAQIASSIPGILSTISPVSSWVPPVSSANDPTVALVSAAATIASAGTTLNGNHRGGWEYITVVDASLLSIVANDWVRVYTSRAQGGDMNGEGGAERYDLVQVRSDYTSGNTIPLATRLRCFHANGGIVRKVTTPVFNVNITDIRLDASGGTMPVLLLMQTVSDSKIDVEIRGASHAAVHSRFGSIRNMGTISDDGERNCALMMENTHDSTYQVNSTGKGARFHRYGRIRGVVHIMERCNDVWINNSALKNGCTGLTQKGAISGGFRNSTISNMRLKERVARPWVMLITANPAPGSDFVTLFATGASPNDTNELRLNDRVMFATTTTLPAPLTAQTVYYAINTTNTTVQLALTPSGPAIDITGTGGSFGEMTVSNRLVTVGASSVLTCKSHGFVVGDEVRFVAIAPGPTGITNTYYYIRSVPTPDTFTISLTQGGALQSVANDGSGILSVERNRAVPAETFSRTGVVWVAAAGFECHGGGQPDATGAERTWGFKIDNVELSDCYHPDGAGNQGSALIVDVVSLYTNNLRIINKGRSDILSVPPGDDHMFGMIFWDNSLITHNGLVIEGCEMGLIFVGGWNRQIFNGCTLAGADGQTNPIWAIVNGQESAAGSSQPVDILFTNLNFYGYAVPIALHPSTWFAPTEYSWSRFRFNGVHFLGNGDQTASYQDVRTCKNVSGVALVGGDVVKMASITDVNTYKLPSVTNTSSTEPQGTGVVLPNPVTWANNARCLVAFGDAVATIEAADTPLPGDFLYSQNANKKLTTVATGARAKGIATAGKISNQAPFRCLT